MNRKLILAAIAVIATAALGFQAVRQAVRPRNLPAALTSITPQGALLTIESPDFAALLRSWNRSAQQKAWLASDNYSVFSNSRLLGRLDDARKEFEGALPSKQQEAAGFDASFLTQIAGRQSLFAWYDVGNLEFLYITRMPAAQAARIAMLQSHAGWSPRQAGGNSFYLRKSKGEGQTRTVAYAQIPTGTGETVVILATREDLLAQTLQLIQTPGDGVASEPWYADALAANSAAPATPPALHMVLNLDRLVPLPAFHTYWVQQNISQMKQYRSSVSDLYAEGATFRDERTLLLKSAQTEPANPALEALAAVAPAGVYRTTATHDPALAITALEEKLLGRATLEKLPDSSAPDPALSNPQSGDAADLETRIDAPAPVASTFSNQALAAALKSAAFDALLTYSTAVPPATPSGLWLPIHSAVVLHSSGPWDRQALQAALQQSLRGNLTTSTLGIEFRAVAGTNTYELSGPKHLYLATRDRLAMLADDQALLSALLARPAGAASASPGYSVIAGFDHISQRAPYARLTSLIDGNNQAPKSNRASVDAANPAPANPDPANPTDLADAPDSSGSPAFFSRNMKSLSDTFAALLSERFVELPVDTPSGPALRQTVTYQWRPQ